ncbi:hypothetical protein Taro_018815 [Colocasia esculenta]|uniref:Uncharacterized protein n=1 Tax=Colocasia esculenta TaxID=4460 RepID=A0A843V3K6_COLES|nr:hypothetical protein [Colocasia esculenta]
MGSQQPPLEVISRPIPSSISASVIHQTIVVPSEQKKKREEFLVLGQGEVAKRRDEFYEQSLGCGSQHGDGGSAQGSGLLQVEPHHQVSPPALQDQPGFPLAGPEDALFDRQKKIGGERAGEAVGGVLEESHVLELLGASWVVAASLGVVEALKDQGFCRWSYAFRQLQQNAKNNVGSVSQARRFSSSVDRRRGGEAAAAAAQSEESLRKVIREQKDQEKGYMGSAGRASWVVAASLGAVEALKDQGFCRWSYAFRQLQQHAKNNVGSVSQARRFSSSVDRRRGGEAAAAAVQSEESLRKVMFLSCWGPN